MKVFFDTMIFLHYKDLDQIDLPAALHATELTIVIPRIVISELDKHKDSHQKRKIRERARSSLKKIVTWFDGIEVRPGISAIEYHSRPKFDLAEKDLDPSRNDDVLIAAILQFKSDNPDDEILLVTHDTGPRLTARRHGIRAIDMSEQHALPDDPDPLERENQDLKARIARIENAYPRVSAVFLTENGNNANHQKIVIRRPPALDEESLRVQLDKLKASLPEIHPAPPTVTSEAPFAVLQQFLKTNMNDVISPEEYDRYNRERSEYFIAYETYLRRQSDYDAMRYVSALLEIAIINSGTAPAEDVDVLLHFPDGFRLFTAENLPKAPEKPTPPINPRSTLAMLTEGLAFASSLPKPYFPEMHALSSMVSSFSIRRTKSYEVEDCFHSIKHGEHERIRDLLLVFDSFESARGFSIDYTLRPRNLPEPVTGQLHIEVEK